MEKKIKEYDFSLPLSLSGTTLCYLAYSVKNCSKTLFWGENITSAKFLKKSVLEGNWIPAPPPHSLQDAESEGGGHTLC